MRLFVAVNFDDVTKSRLLSIQEKIKEKSVRGNFTKPENFHLTLLFIGEVNAGLVPCITSIMEKLLPIPKTYTINFDRTGCFRHSGKELWWIGTDHENETGISYLSEIRRQIGDGLDMAGIPYDRRPFKAHITLGREIKPTAPITLPNEKINIPVNHISLMKSEHIRGILTYTEIFKWQ